MTERSRTTHNKEDSLVEDPVGASGEENLYSYAGNDPIDHYDTDGMRFIYCSLTPTPAGWRSD